jgi:hypothetical protein
MGRIAIPTDADVATRRAFEEIENRLAALERKSIDIGATTADKEMLEKEILDLKDDPTDLQVNGDLWVANDVTAAGTIDMPHLHEGLIKPVPSAEAGTHEAQRVINVHGSLAVVPGGVSAASVDTRNITAKDVSAKTLSGTLTGDVTGDVTGKVSGITFPMTEDRGVVIENDVTYVTAVTLNHSMWPADGTITGAWAKRIGGSGASVNAENNGANIRSANLSLTTTAWTGWGSLQNTAVTDGQTLEFEVLSVTGNVTQISIFLQWTRSE